MKDFVYIGTCGHEYDREWQENANSCYTVLDEVSGAYVNVTTCEDCYNENLNAGRIVDESEIPFDDYNPFEDDPAPDTMVVFDNEGNSEVVELDKE